MHEYRLLGLAVLLLLPVLMTSFAAEISVPKPPSTKAEPVVDKLHGVEIADPYRWLEDQQSPATRKWLDEQIGYARGILDKLPGRKTIQKRLEELMKVDRVDTPAARGDRYFFSKREANKELSVLCMRKGLEGPDEVLVDPHGMSADNSTSVHFMDISDDGRWFVYGVRKGGEDEVELRLFDVDGLKDHSDRLPKARYGSIELTPDAKGLYYSRYDSDKGPSVWFHAIGSSAGDKRVTVPREYGQGKWLAVDLSDNGEHLLVSAFHGSAAMKSEVYYQRLGKDEGLRVLVDDIEARFEPMFAGDRVILQTNWDAPNGRLILVDPAKGIGKEHWAPIVAESKATLESCTAAAGRLFVRYLDNVRSRVEIVDLAGKRTGEIEFPSLGTVSGVSGRWSSSETFYSFSSFHIPSTIYRYDADSKQSKEWFRENVPLNKEIEIVVRQVWYPSKDGTKIPMFLVHRKNLTLNGDNPTYLTGYGGFNLSRAPGFSSTAIIWIENGGVFALPNLRGGGEFGEAWHEAGMLDKKQNVFDDFLGAAEWLIEQGYTNPKRLCITGGSNGGLLVGAAMTQRPELFAAVVCSVPLLDMLRYHQFLVARFWTPEYGSADDPEQFKVLRAYSPYHNVRPNVDYPAVMFVTGDADTRVDPLHARKMTALLQNTPGVKEPVLLRYETISGHSAGLSTQKTIESTTDQLSFLFWQLDVPPVRVLPGGASVQVRDGVVKLSGSPRGPGLDELFTEEWEYDLKEDPTFASHLGDDRYNDRWPDRSPESFGRRRQHYEEVVERIARFDDKLSESDRVNLALFRREYEQRIVELDHRWHLMPLNQRGGVQTENELADRLTFNTVKDYEDWITRLNTLPKYIEQTTDLMREGIKSRMLHAKVVMERVPEQIRKQIVSDPTRSLFYKPFERMDSDISQAEQHKLREQAQQAIREQVVPAYERFLTFFEKEYLPACLDRVGCWQLPDGKKLYAERIRNFTTTNLSAEEVHKIGLREVERIRGEMQKVIQQVGFKGTFAEFLDMLRTDKRFYFEKAEDLLEAYRALSKRVDPTLVKLFRTIPRAPYGVEPIPMNIAPDTTTAYYVQPAADGSRPGTYYVNLFKPETRPKYEMEALSLHEAVPGHHFQIALAMELGDLPEFRRYGGYTAYVEGWGLYAESLGDELGLYQDPYSKFGQLTYEMWRAVRLVVDTGMHDLGWTREQAIEFFKANAAKTELDIVNEIDRYISWPGQALAYKIGELKIKELRARAAKRLGDRFDIRDFHDVVLGSGAIPLDMLEDNVEDWLDGNRDSAIFPWLRLPTSRKE